MAGTCTISIDGEVKSARVATTIAELREVALSIFSSPAREDLLLAMGDALIVVEKGCEFHSPFRIMKKTAAIATKAVIHGNPLTATISAITGFANLVRQDIKTEKDFSQLFGQEVWGFTQYLRPGPRMENGGRIFKYRYFEPDYG